MYIYISIYSSLNHKATFQMADNDNRVKFGIILFMEQYSLEKKYSCLKIEPKYKKCSRVAEHTKMVQIKRKQKENRTR